MADRYYSYYFYLFKQISRNEGQCSCCETGVMTMDSNWKEIKTLDDVLKMDLEWLRRNNPYGKLEKYLKDILSNLLVEETEDD